jgi:hypothetical protein
MTGRKWKKAMARENRCKLIADLEAKRGNRLVISYITSNRFGNELENPDDILLRLYRHLELAKVKNRLRNGVDIFLHSNGGSSGAPSRIVNLVREFTSKFSVLVPHHAFGAATSIALGADSIVMHKMGLLGPIDRDVATPLNSPNPQGRGQRPPISVGDLLANFKFAKERIGAEHEYELIQTVIALIEKMSPGTRGRVEPEDDESLLLAATRMKETVSSRLEHQIGLTGENFESNRHFHPIDRREAKDDLKLKVEFANTALEESMWQLYESYEAELRLNARFDPVRELDIRSADTHRCNSAAYRSVRGCSNGAGRASRTIGPRGAGGPSEKQPVKGAAVLAPFDGGSEGSRKSKDRCRLEKMKCGYLESLGRTDVFLSDVTIERSRVKTATGVQDMVTQEPTWQRWEVES